MTIKAVLDLFPSREIAIEWLRFQLLDNGKFYKDVAEELGVTRQWIQHLCVVYKIDISQRTARWYAKRWNLSELEDAFWLMEQKAKGNIGIKKLVKELGISCSRFRKQIIRLGLVPNDFQAKPKESREERVSLRCIVCGKPVSKKISLVEGRRYVFCSESCRSKVQGEKFGFGSKRILWQDAIDYFIKNNWQDMTDQEIASEFDLSASAITTRRRKLELFRKTGPKPKGLINNETSSVL